MLTDCLEACQSNDTCGAVNYETGLCVLFSSNADKQPGKRQSALQFPFESKTNKSSMPKKKTAADVHLKQRFTRMKMNSIR